MPRKRRIEEIVELSEPTFSEQQRLDFERGIRLFNSGDYWHAHEAWEQAWLQMPDDSGGDAEIFLRGLVQLAAALHLRSCGRDRGMRNNVRKAREKLRLAPERFLGIDVAGALAYLESGCPGDLRL